MDDYMLDDGVCPDCGHAPVHWRTCSEIGCQDGWIDEYDDDPINYAPGEAYAMCATCRGTGIECWCPACGADLSGKELVDDA
jgi:hypothetical protein